MRRKWGGWLGSKRFHVLLKMTVKHGRVTDRRTHQIAARVCLIPCTLEKIKQIPPLK